MLYYILAIIFLSLSAVDFCCCKISSRIDRTTDDIMQEIFLKNQNK